MIALKIKIYKDPADENVFCAVWEVDKDETLAGYGANPYEALQDLISEIEYQEVFRPD